MSKAVKRQYNYFFIYLFFGEDKLDRISMMIVNCCRGSDEGHSTTSTLVIWFTHKNTLFTAKNEEHHGMQYRNYYGEFSGHCPTCHCLLTP